ncbi:ribosome biogenesis protein SPATA5L1 [Anastrepha obliqua]|uniref:ribosome biogenesis protein SPATA5L1 n=1 Tax=Anastrepha obliqua TaxID=95512 RepID=UPI00240A05D0|nr:ribosome biogenesis protein SPATA5L1 [Anastrepha obliqua]XP_054735176.1 ribosome biogenesis protein SPATA5L1 [Anastrepha obliqua]
MKHDSDLGLCTLPLEFIQENVYQKCLLPKNVFKTCRIHPGDWMKCMVAKGELNGFVLCQIYPRDIDPKCCYMDTCVGTLTSADVEYSLNSLETIACHTLPIENVEVTLEVTEHFFNRRLRKLSANTLEITIKGTLASLHLSVGCAVRTADAVSLGISAIYIDSCSNADENTIFQIDSSTAVHIKNIHIGQNSNINCTMPFFKYGYEFAWNELEDLLSLLKLQKIQNKTKGLRPQLNVLLSGSPGCGKTTMLRAFLAEYKFNCFHIATDLQQYAGETEAELRSVFNNALHLHNELKSKYPTVIILESLELLCPAQSRGSSTADATNSNRICEQLLKLLDDFHNTNAGILCIATTSDSSGINDSARRPGRFQHEISIDAPNEQARRKLFQAMFEYSQSKPFLNKMKLNTELLDLVAKRTQGFVAGDLALLVQNIEQNQMRQKRVIDEVDVVKSALNLIKPAAAHSADVTVSKIKEGFEFIGGMDNLKRTLEVSFLTGLRRRETFKRFGLKLPKGLLLYGPPGCAKTTFAKCLSKEADMTFISISGAEVYSPYVGFAEKFISRIFNTARKNAPCLLFFDEIDALAGRRPISSNSSSDVQVRVLSTLLTEMDGIIDGADDSNQEILVVAASNRPDMIDDALLRPGRLSKHIFVPPPDLQSRISILELHSKRMPFAEDVNLVQVAEAADDYTGADMCNLSNEAALLAFQRIEEVKADCRITANDFFTALKNTKSSLSRSHMSLYSRFQRKMETN